MGPDFSGYVTKYGVRCTDGRMILAHAFKGNDGAKIPLVWQHQHADPANVLGHLVLAHREDGVWCDGFFNETPSGKQAKALVIHKDIDKLSIFANQIVQNGSNVTHGQIREGSLVLAGANPGAFIQNINVAHGDDVQVLDSEAVIFSGEAIVHAGSTTVSQPTRMVPGNGSMPAPSEPGDSTGDGPSVDDVFNSLTDVQKETVYALIGAAAEHSGIINPDTQKGDTSVTRNVFNNGGDGAAPAGITLSHDDMKGIFADAVKTGSLKEALNAYTVQHGIDNIDQLFPFERDVQDTPEFISRRMEWVQSVLGGVRKTPFARIRTRTADITMDDARARGYIKGTMKKEEFFPVARRVTTPQTVYKKQKLDRDDIVDITDFDVVTWLMTEMRVMLDEEIARAVLVGDGRAVDDPDKINETNIRPILTDDELYVTTLNIDLTDASSSPDEIVDAIVAGMQYYRGSGNPVLYTTLPYLSKLLLAKDTLGRRLYASKTELATAMGVRDIVPVEVMEGYAGVIGIIVNLTDYTIGADKQGQVTSFDFFDIDFNQYKYLTETRCSGALIKFKCALALREFSGAGGMLADPTPPTFVKSTGVVTIPTIPAHVSYVTVNDTTGVESSALTTGAQTAITAGSSVHIRAKAASTYSFTSNATDDWTFKRDSA